MWMKQNDQRLDPDSNPLPRIKTCNCYSAIISEDEAKRNMMLIVIPQYNLLAQVPHNPFRFELSTILDRELDDR